MISMTRFNEGDNTCLLPLIVVETFRGSDWSMFEYICLWHTTW